MSGTAKAMLIVLIIFVTGGAMFFLRDKDGKNTGETLAETALIKVTSPLPNAVVSSPLVVTGEARGNWYFEASFPIKIVDANGKVLGQIPVQAQGDWMTTQFVPFRASLPFSSSTTATGTLVLEKDNPSGLPENAAEFRIPIRFR